MICYGSVLAFVADGNKGFANFWFAGFRGVLELVVEIWRQLIKHYQPIVLIA
ncbi:MAG: hypothetical protein AVDCRST_MAG74-2047 [uncultured Pyrinomonadaceae bacterium]|uniref:Uncharacterized protein n=1 Tax=uncultured Pyrinomonadaceae bacterium TaxID=2283094 RepID=A0A6J4P719_9BACT|nr:MAG: hypothetical protein AVDCRST_MAG74-2047 [uncultured Pyrinomonadaceae bacterium]